MHRLQTSQRGRSFPINFHSGGGTAASVLTAIRTSRRVARSSVSRPEWSIPRPSRSPIPASKRPSIGRVTRPERSGRMQIAWPSATTRCTQFSLSVRKRELGAARGCRWPCDLHPARALGCGSRSRHMAYRRPLLGAGIGARDGVGIDHSGRGTEDRATRLEVRMAVRTVAAVSPPLWKLYSQRIGKLRPAIR